MCTFRINFLQNNRKIDQQIAKAFQNNHQQILNGISASFSDHNSVIIKKCNALCNLEKLMKNDDDEKVNRLINNNIQVTS